MIMYGVYNSGTLTTLIRTVHNKQNTTTWKERTFAGKLNQMYQVYLNKEGTHNSAINSVLFLTTVREKYVKMYKRFQLTLWDWIPSTDSAFQCLKAWICQTLLKVTLAFYDRSKPVVVQTDISKFGLGAALLQGGWPIAFASKTCTDVESHYVNIERECLSVCFGLVYCSYTCLALV